MKKLLSVIVEHPEILLVFVPILLLIAATWPMPAVAITRPSRTMVADPNVGQPKTEISYLESEPLTIEQIANAYSLFDPTQKAFCRITLDMIDSVDSVVYVNDGSKVFHNDGCHHKTDKSKAAWRPSCDRAGLRPGKCCIDKGP